MFNEGTPVAGATAAGRLYGSPCSSKSTSPRLAAEEAQSIGFVKQDFHLQVDNVLLLGAAAIKLLAQLCQPLLELHQFFLSLDHVLVEVFFDEFRQLLSHGRCFFISL